MMISPEGFAESLSDLPYERLVAEKDQLVREIADFEKSRNSNDPVVEINPAPEVVYQCNLRYLAKLCDMLADAYNKQFIQGL